MKVVSFHSFFRIDLIDSLFQFQQVMVHIFFRRKIFIRQWTSKTPKPYKVLRKSPANASIYLLAAFRYFRALTKWANLSLLYKSNHRRCSIRKLLLKILQYSGKPLCWKAFRPATLFKRDSNAGVFSWILQNF